MISKITALLAAALIVSGSFAQKTTIDLTTSTEVNYGSTLTLKKGQNFEVLLKENPTTGYIW